MFHGADVKEFDVVFVKASGSYVDGEVRAWH